MAFSEYSQLPNLSLPAGFNGHISAGPFIPANQLSFLGATTFTARTNDTRFVIQYYHHVEAASERIAIERWLFSMTQASDRPAAHDDTRRWVLHCRDPRLQPSQADDLLMVWHKLPSVDVVQLRDMLGRMPVFAPIVHAQDQLWGFRHMLASKRLAVDDESRVKDGERREFKLVNKLNRDYSRRREMEEYAARDLLEGRKAEAVRLYWETVRQDAIQWSDDEIRVLTWCHERGDLDKVRDMVEARRRAARKREARKEASSSSYR